LVDFSPLSQDALKPLCNLSMESALELFTLLRSHVNWTAVTDEAEEFTGELGQQRINLRDYGVLLRASEDVRRDVLEKPSIRKVRSVE